MIKSQFTILLTVLLLCMGANKLQAQGSMRYGDEDFQSKWVLAEVLEWDFPLMEAVFSCRQLLVTV